MQLIQHINKIIFSILLLSCSCAYGQHKIQLRTSDSVHRVGYINHTMVRNGFRQMNTYRSEKRSAFLALKSKYSEDVHKDSVNMAKSMKADSITGGKQKKSITQSWQAKKETLSVKYDKDQRANHKQTVEGMRQLDQRIQLAIQQTVIEMGLTEVKSFDKEAIPKSGVDITAVVLAKLNK